MKGGAHETVSPRIEWDVSTLCEKGAEYAVKRMELGERWRRWREELDAYQTALCAEGRKRVLVKGCEELLTYETDLIRVRTESGVAAISGKGLSMRSFHGSSILIEGDWAAVRWEGEGV